MIYKDTIYKLETKIVCFMFFKSKTKLIKNSKQLGKHGETKAIAFLKKQGFKILETNYRVKSAEIDIIAKDRDTIRFIEVKTRSSTTKGLPREAVTRTKQNKIIHAALIYIKKNKLSEKKIGFDVVEVQQEDGQFSFNLIKNAFMASM
jgi:putative endonuclease